MSRSQVLVGVNLLELVPGRPEATLLTTITHVYHKADSESSGITPVVEFVKNLRELNEKKQGQTSK